MKTSTRLPTDLQELFAQQLGVEVPSPETDLIDSGLLDSLSFVELLVQLEQRYGVQVSVDDLELENFRTLDRIAVFVNGARTAG
ncbi:MAG: acyl carrier protein [Planctomycetota bacterium]|jgi:acyl carrier protein